VRAPSRALLWVGAALALAACGRQRDAEVPLVSVKKQKFARVVEADGYLRPVKAIPVSVPDSDLPLRITWLAPDGVPVKKGDVLARFDDFELRAQLADGQSDREVAAAKRSKERLLLDTASRDRARTTAAAGRELLTTRSFQRRDSAIFSRDQIVESEIDEQLQEAKVEHARKSETLDRRLGGNKLALIGVEARKADEAIRRASKGLGALKVESPHDGVFTIKRGWMNQPLRVGDTVWRGMGLAELSRVEDLEAELFVLEVEAAGLASGRRAELLLEAGTGKVFGARVKSVETVAKRREQKSPTQYFGVVLTLEKTDPEIMKPGQSVRARLFLHEQEALVLPRPALFDQDGRWIAYRREPQGGFAAVPVKIGPSTAGLCTIESGLRENDVVALRDPGRSPADLLSRPEGASRPRP
jgi:HlyD family secretion protein